MPRCVFLSHPQPRDSGDYLHRVTQPARALARHWRVDDLQTSHPAFVEHAVEADLLVVLMVADPVVGEVMVRRRGLGRPTVYEISDDFRHFPKTVQGHAFYSNPEVQRSIEALAQSADLLQFSSRGLAEVYGHLNPRQAVLPNQLETVPALPRRGASKAHPPVLGWAGSAGHAADARHLAALLTQWLRQRRSRGCQQRFTLKVMAAESIVDAFRQTGLRVVAHRPGNFSSYMNFLAGLDIGFAVIGTDAFSAGRSDGKFIEMASRGVVCVASALGEYRRTVHHGRTGFLFHAADEFTEHMDRLVGNATLRQEVRQAAHRYVLEERTHEAAVQQRLLTYGGLLSPMAHDGAAEPQDPPSGLRCMAEPAELEMLEASIRQMNGRLAQALALYMDLMQRAPDFYLPWQRAASIAAALGSAHDAEMFSSLAASKLRSALGRDAQTSRAF